MRRFFFLIRQQAALLSMIATIAAAIVWIAVTAHRDATRHFETPHPAIPDRAKTSPLNLAGGGPAPAEAYEVYSDLYRTSVDEPLIFAEDSVIDIPQLDGSCLHPSTAAEEQLVAAFEAANRQRHRWERRFRQTAYNLASREEADRIRGCLDTARATGRDCAAYPGVRHVRYLGVPGFSPDGAQALVSVIRMCGADCGSGGIFAMKKAGGRWVRAESTGFTSDCSWMY